MKNASSAPPLVDLLGKKRKRKSAKRDSFYVPGVASISPICQPCGHWAILLAKIAAKLQRNLASQTNSINVTRLLSCLFTVSWGWLRPTFVLLCQKKGRTHFCCCCCCSDPLTFGMFWHLRYRCCVSGDARLVFLHCGTTENGLIWTEQVETEKNARRQSCHGETDLTLP